MRTPEVNICSLDGVKQQLSHSYSLHIDKMRLEESFGGPKPLSTHLHLPAVRELQHRKGAVKTNLLTLEPKFDLNVTYCV